MEDMKEIVQIIYCMVTFIFFLGDNGQRYKERGESPNGDIGTKKKKKLIQGLILHHSIINSRKKIP